MTLLSLLIGRTPRALAFLIASVTVAADNSASAQCRRTGPEMPRLTAPLLPFASKHQRKSEVAVAAGVRRTLLPPTGVRRNGRRSEAVRQRVFPIRGETKACSRMSTPAAAQTSSERAWLLRIKYHEDAAVARAGVHGAQRWSLARISSATPATA